MNTLLVLGIAHVLGDYVLQSHSLAEKKQKPGGEGLFLHALLYALAMASVFLCAGQSAGRAWALLSLSHWVIDAIRIRLGRRWSGPGAALLLFCTDQALHLAMIILCWLWFLRSSATPLFLVWSGHAWFRPILLYAAMLCILTKPSAILIRLALQALPTAKLDKPAAPTEGPPVPDESTAEPPASAASASLAVGALIGMLERVIVAALYLSGAATAIGFVLTAKSIARFKEFESRDFTERYLVGTLLSVALALLTVMLFSRFLP